MLTHFELVTLCFLFKTRSAQGRLIHGDSEAQEREHAAEVVGTVRRNTSTHF